jgi:hypothetical protein
MYIPHEQYEFRDRVAERLSDKDKKKKKKPVILPFILRITINKRYLKF